MKTKEENKKFVAVKPLFWNTLVYIPFTPTKLIALRLQVGETALVISVEAEKGAVDEKDGLEAIQILKNQLEADNIEFIWHGRNHQAINENIPDRIVIPFKKKSRGTGSLVAF